MLHAVCVYTYIYISLVIQRYTYKERALIKHSAPVWPKSASPQFCFITEHTGRMLHASISVQHSQGNALKSMQLLLTVLQKKE